jgi:hypothetical protein
LSASPSGAAPQGTPDGAQLVLPDLAQETIPSYVIAENGSSDSLRPATNDEYPDKNPATAAVKYRRPFRDSVAVLCGMVLFLVGAVVVILVKRDNDPQ